MSKVQDDKYIVFKRNEYYELMGEFVLPPWEGGQGELFGKDIDCAPIAEIIRGRSEDLCLDDAVVIRRQDKFASPCLATYAACIAMVAAEIDDPVKQANLLKVSDYFEQQAQLAAEEGYHLPD